ncbi:MAG: hypothetical protein E2O68_08055 [Deltaproteobacteria bacterium]|nr:MAG: hypothetical protein E2O68_08055 [Deltaproteobacteria bacterium]
MFKTTAILFGLLISFSTLASDRFVMITFHGLGGFESDRLEESRNISEELSNVGVERMYNGGHGVNKRKWQKVLDNFDCRNGQQMNEDLGLIIIGYSWGARKSYEFSKAYHKKCGQKAERAYMIDGIQKLITSFRHAPVAKVCKNYYKRKGIISGKALKGCENSELTEICVNTSGMQCHQVVLREGFRLVMDDITSL